MGESAESMSAYQVLDLIEVSIIFFAAINGGEIPLDASLLVCSNVWDVPGLGDL